MVGHAYHAFSDNRLGPALPLVCHMPGVQSKTLDASPKPVTARENVVLQALLLPTL